MQVHRLIIIRDCQTDEDMKTLLLLRHAKSSWADPGRSDHDRELNRRGEKAAPFMGRYLRQHELVPDLIWCSTAARAVQTLGLLGRDFATDADVIYNEDLYMASERVLLENLHHTHEDAKQVMFVGHNPGIEVFAQSLYGDGNADAREIMARKYPTCALAHFEFDVDHWGEIAPGTGRLIDFIKVKDLQAVKIGPEPIAK
ncbi:phosphohistidine phosphatase [Thalassospira sp. MCCC 1A01148]|jgi:phosphohistidine phosphatase|nr:phosphohistidine phosphatase [Thalassospira sp. MCCC 1A01148]MBS8272190.1 histidine phosphatase family protein [Thalassospira tepidiphila]|tara:strand:- start:1612 stop:2211 length:600 start_codon:yes stop_codon:yes gene_type:complete